MAAASTAVTINGPNHVTVRGRGGGAGGGNSHLKVSSGKVSALGSVPCGMQLVRPNAERRDQRNGLLLLKVFFFFKL